ncbi:acyl-CoA dehydrogenase family protein [Actinoplanes sp. NPDC049548]|uniref:acyl-CoA dehydrogenase family protein n=1 Tax=Actinoplanes sp. NPDC049548 TaxID=3155152 RepID=UPI003422FD2A
MTFLDRERAALDAALPGLDTELTALGVAAEARDSGVVELFRKAGGGNLLIPAALGGLGASALTAVRVQRALGSRSPSLAVGGTMHHYKVAWLAGEVREPAKLDLLRQVAQQRWLVASCGAEGSRGLFNPGIEVRGAPGAGLIVSGTKRPCSLVWSMGVLSMLLATPADGPYAGDLVNVLVQADDPGITRSALWGSPVLAAAQTDEIRLTDVPVPPERVIRLGRPGSAIPLVTASLVWFEVLITAAYLGAASGLVERALDGRRGRPEDRSAAAGALEAVAAAVEGAAAGIDRGELDEAALGRALFVRYAAQRAIAESTDRALDLLGGGVFASGPEALHLLGASRGLAFHPPAEAAMRDSLADHLTLGGLALA